MAVGLHCAPMAGLVSLLFFAAGLLIPPGRPSPQLVARTMAGKVWRGQLSGEVTLVEFSATWCPHCRKSLAGYHQLLASRQVRLIVVDVDEDPAAVAAYFGRHPLPGGAGLLVDIEGHARRTWGVTAFPAVFLIDKAGVIRDSFSGWDDAGGIRYLAGQIDQINRAGSHEGAHARAKPALSRRDRNGKVAGRARR
jgi:thiol-disulfide isomerase/thioredoxin